MDGAQQSNLDCCAPSIWINISRWVDDPSGKSGHDVDESSTGRCRVVVHGKRRKRRDHPSQNSPRLSIHMRRRSRKTSVDEKSSSFGMVSMRRAAARTMRGKNLPTAMYCSERRRVFSSCFSSHRYRDCRKLVESRFFNKFS